jgi:hypothetical protein
MSTVTRGFQNLLPVVAACGALLGAAAAQAIGPDVLWSDITDVGHYGPVGSIHAYALGTGTCNIGNQNLLWTGGGTPAAAMNMYRLADGRLRQIGMGWAKTACCAGAGSGCGICNGQGGSVLGAGCRDVYGASWNGIQARLGPRSGINGFTGAMAPLPSGTGDAIYRRLQVNASEFDPLTYPGALYFAEGVYVATDDAQSHNSLNNASYRRGTFSGSTFGLTGSTLAGSPAILAWRDHGLGVGVPDPSVLISIVDIPGEGRFYGAGKARHLPSGLWRYEYAVFNLNSDRAGGSLAVPIQPGTAVTGIGFHDVDYHSGEPYDPTDWTSTLSAGAVSWTSPQTFAQNPSSNALRWGTMHNFWFDANAAPASALGSITLGLFKPYSPQSVTIDGMPVPGQGCRTDVNSDGALNVADFLAYLVLYASNDPRADFTNDGAVDVSDFLAYLTQYSAGCA